jgi:hypothetical protein
MAPNFAESLAFTAATHAFSICLSSAAALPLDARGVVASAAFVCAYVTAPPMQNPVINNIAITRFMGQILSDWFRLNSRFPWRQNFGSIPIPLHLATLADRLELMR